MTLNQYLDKVPKERRQKLESLLTLIRSLYPNAEESMKYKMPTFEHQDGWVAIANQKHYLSLYTCSPIHLKEFKARHPEIKTGKGCINFNDSDAIPMEDVRAVILSAMEFGYGH